MNVHVSYKSGKTPDVEQEFQHQINKLERRLHVFKSDLVHLHGIIDQQNSHLSVASLNLRLPSGQLAAQKTGENALAAVKGAFAELISQVTRHKEMLRGHWQGKSRRGNGADQLSQVPAELEMPATPVVAQKKSPATADDGASHSNVQTWLAANLKKLEAFIDRELAFRVEAEQIREGQITREEVLDEVIVSALSHDDGRAQLLSLEGWFHRLALQAVQRLISSNADVGNISLDAPAGIQNVTGSDENVLQYHQPDDRISEESIVRDENILTPEEIVAGEEMVAQLDLVLHGVGAADREAFVLFTLEGFTVEEVARLSSRSHEQVRASIQHAREHVQKKLPPQDQFRRSLLKHSRVA